MTVPNQFYQARPDSPKDADRIVPERELVNGLDVVLVLRVFESQVSRRKDITLHAVILQEPVKYRDGIRDHGRIGLKKPDL